MHGPRPSGAGQGELVRRLEAAQVPRLERKNRVYSHHQFLGTDLLANHWYQLPGKVRAGSAGRRGGSKVKGAASLSPRRSSVGGSSEHRSRHLSFLRVLHRGGHDPGGFGGGAEGVGGGWPS